MPFCVLASVRSDRSDLSRLLQEAVTPAVNRTNSSRLKGHSGHEHASNMSVRVIAWKYDTMRSFAGT